jgi:hypothetical protein
MERTAVRVERTDPRAIHTSRVATRDKILRIFRSSFARHSWRAVWAIFANAAARGGFGIVETAAGTKKARTAPRRAMRSISSGCAKAISRAVCRSRRNLANSASTKPPKTSSTTTARTEDDPSRFYNDASSSLSNRSLAADGWPASPRRTSRRTSRNVRMIHSSSEGLAE